MVDPEAPARTWTLEEANAALGRISAQVRAAMEAADAATVLDIARDLATEGVLLRDHASGLIDFQTVLETQRTLLNVQDSVVSAEAELTAGHVLI